MISEPTNARQCERCHRETNNLIRFMTGSTPHQVCPACLYREDKRINLRGEWRREGQRRRKG